jgi:hypothetical protein
MRKLTFLLLFLLPTLAAAQKLAGSFQEATDYSGLSLQELDQQYKSAIHSNPALAVFKGQEEEFIAAYKSMLTDLAIYLIKRK